MPHRFINHGKVHLIHFYMIDGSRKKVHSCSKLHTQNSWRDNFTTTLWPNLYYQIRCRVYLIQFIKDVLPFSFINFPINYFWMIRSSLPSQDSLFASSRCKQLPKKLILALTYCYSVSLKENTGVWCQSRNPCGVFTSDLSFSQEKIDGELHAPWVHLCLCNGYIWPPGAYWSQHCVCMWGRESQNYKQSERVRYKMNSKHACYCIKTCVKEI